MFVKIVVIYAQPINYIFYLECFVQLICLSSEGRPKIKHLYVMNLFIYRKMHSHVTGHMVHISLNNKL